MERVRLNTQRKVAKDRKAREGLTTRFTELFPGARLRVAAKCGLQKASGKKTQNTELKAKAPNQSGRRVVRDLACAAGSGPASVQHRGLHKVLASEIRGFTRRRRRAAVAYGATTGTACLQAARRET